MHVYPTKFGARFCRGPIRTLPDQILIHPASGVRQWAVVQMASRECVGECGETVLSVLHRFQYVEVDSRIRKIYYVRFEGQAVVRAVLPLPCSHYVKVDQHRQSRDMFFSKIARE
ncbi:unnamed protein product, partial [Ectocarpus sp. 12 AP-2014]